MGAFSFKPGLHIRGRTFHGLRGFGGKPFHPPLTDIPVGAYTIGPVLDIISWVFKKQSWSADLGKAGGYIILAGAAVSLLTALTGFADWLTTRKGSQMRRMANAHAVTMITMTVLVLVDLYLRYIHYTNLTTPGLVIVGIDVVILLLVTIGGTIGGSLVYDYGFNVVAGPETEMVNQPSRTDVIK